MKIGIAGTGRMGIAIGQRLIEQGDELVVWNRTKDRAKPLVTAGARMAASAADLVGSVDIVITILTNAEAIDAMYRGKDGLLSGDVAGKLFMEMSTVRPETEEKGNRCVEHAKKDQASMNRGRVNIKGLKQRWVRQEYG